MRILSAEDVRAALPMSDAIDAVKAGFIALSAGKAHVPVRGVLQHGDNITLTMPAAIDGGPVRSVKIVSVNPGNHERNLPMIHAVVYVADAETGAPLALMDGELLTAIRTGAGSGVATDLLARPDAAVLGVIGTGAQARTQIEAVCAVRQITEIRLFSRTNPHALASEISGQYPARVIVAPTREAALKNADVVVAATNSPTPVVTLADLKPGAHVNGVGSFTAQMQEVAADVVLTAKVVVDDTSGAWAEAGDLIIPHAAGQFAREQVYAEVGEIAAGSKPGRTADDEITFFKSVGNGVQDIVTASRVLERAAALGLGTVVNL